jgi:hypothetical protein
MKNKQWEIKRVKEYRRSIEMAKIKAKKQQIKNDPFYKPRRKILNVKYKVFLKSKYWKMVREKVLIRDKHKCPNTYKLEVHHLTYEHHTNEHLYLEDLITICADCHHTTHFPDSN